MNVHTYFRLSYIINLMFIVYLLFMIIEYYISLFDNKSVFYLLVCLQFHTHRGTFVVFGIMD